ncbi:MAG: prepilin-type N-terminal cleavage/methylation domain-containing protein [Patescibacteria group bacterium]
MDKLKNKTITGGFSLIELMVTIVIFVIISSVIIFNYPNFRDKMSLSREVANIVSDIRTAQVYSLGTKQHENFGINEIKGYGVYFNTTSPKQYQIFLDLTSSDNRIYNVGEEVGSAIQITTTNKISSLKCGGGSCSNNEVSIFYSRPYVNAFISDNGTNLYDYVEIEVQSTSNSSLKKTIKVNKTTGHVEVY